MIARPSSHRSLGEVSGAVAMQEVAGVNSWGWSVETMAVIELEQLRRVHYE